MVDDVRSAPRDLSALRIPRKDDAPRPARTGRWILLGLVVLGAGFWAWKTWSAGARRPEVETALVRLVGAAEESALLSASGYILPDRKADVSSKIFGRLEWIGVDVGSQVKKDAVIGRLANADVAAQVEEAKANLRDAEREYARWKKIVDDGLEPGETLDKAETLLQLVRARVKQAEAAFEYTLIRAPFDGVVTKRNVQVGETVGPIAGGGTSTVGSLCTIVDRSSLEMVADVNETHIAKVKVGQKAEVAADARPEKKYRGEVRQVVPTADRQKGIVQVKVRLLDVDDALLPEMAARASFLRGGAEAGAPRKVIAPRGSLRERGAARGVFVLEGTRVRFQEVQVGAEGEDGAEILKGLHGGETVVTGGPQIEDGADVRLKKP